MIKRMKTVEISYQQIKLAQAARIQHFQYNIKILLLFSALLQ